jgi:N-formylglutamate amidohydrolase
LKERHQSVLLWEAHAIAIVLPPLFDSKLPDVNLGTQDGRTAAATVQRAAKSAAATGESTWIANGRFKARLHHTAFWRGASWHPRDPARDVPVDACE